MSKIEFEDVFEIDGKTVRLKDNFDSSVAVDMFIEHVNSKISNAVPVKELLLNASTATLNQIELSIKGFHAFLEEINSKIKEVSESEETSN